MNSSALTMDVVNELYAQGETKLESYMWDYASFARHLQTLDVEGSLGEPKFMVDGTPFRSGWCRPQNDGPALEASTLMRFARAYMAKGGSVQKVKEMLYDGKFPSQSVIKSNLEYVSDKWQETNTCDLVGYFPGG